MSDVHGETIVDPANLPVDDEQAILAEISEGGTTKPGKAELLDREADAGADYLEGLLDIADLEGDIDIEVEGNRAMVSVVEAESGELRHLVGENGRVLDALQELARLAATRETGERSRLMLDIAGFRAARKAELVKLAKAAVAEAQRTAGPVRMDPMTPFERKVVHDVAAEAGLASESEGEEPTRYVVIRTA